MTAPGGGQLTVHAARVFDVVLDPDHRRLLAGAVALPEDDASAPVLSLVADLGQPECGEHRVADAVAVAEAAGGASAPADRGARRRLEAVLLVVRGGTVDLCGKQLELLGDDFHRLARDVAVAVLDAMEGGEQLPVVRKQIGDEPSELRASLGL